MDRNELRREAGAHRRELVGIGQRLQQLEAIRNAAAAKLKVPDSKLFRDGLLCGAGIILAFPTSGVSLVLTFWSSCSPLVDGLDISSDTAELYAA